MARDALLIAAIDAGSPANVGWAIHGEAGGCGQPDLLIDAIHAQLTAGGCVALGIEAPLWFPAGRPFEHMTKARDAAERTRPWSAGAGPCVMAAGLSNLTWLLEQLERGTCITTQPERFGAVAPLLIWEAFVSGTAKALPRSNEADARLAAAVFAEQWPALDPLFPQRLLLPAVNLAAAVIIATGHTIEPDEFGLPIPVVGPVEDARGAL